MWGERDAKLGKRKRVLRQYSLNKHGKLGDYLKAKKAIIDANKDIFSLLVFMGRAKAVSFE